jgi:hypothetical protein
VNDDTPPGYHTPTWPTPEPPKPGFIRPRNIAIGCGALVLVCVLCLLATSIPKGAVSSTSVTFQLPTLAPTETNIVIPTVAATAATAQVTATSAATATMPAQPTHTPKPACNTDGAPPNPWCYTFVNTGKLIYSPPSNFCDYFNCNSSFSWSNPLGYVDECNDGTYSSSGGRSGDCSKNGGVQRKLYQP